MIFLMKIIIGIMNPQIKYAKIKYISPYPYYNYTVGLITASVNVIM